jgi:hypothetical protein
MQAINLRNYGIITSWNITMHENTDLFDGKIEGHNAD